MTMDPKILSRISALPPSKREMLLQRLRSETATGPGSAPIGPRPDGPVPLSYAQQRLWFLDQLDPGSIHYNVPTAARIHGPISADLLQRSLDHLVRRHESLRTTFVLADDVPVQVVHDTMSVPLVEHDLSEVPDEDRADALSELVVAHMSRPFDLETGPLVSAGIVHLAPDEHVLMASVHHIITDTWSMQIIVRELSIIYQALAHGQRPPLEALHVQYPDFAHWQREWLRGDVLEEQLAYWREQLDGDVPMLDLPMDRPRPAQQSYRGAELAHWFPDSVREGVDALARSEKTGSFSVLLAGLAVLLHRYSGQDRVGVGTPIVNRGRPELEGMVGYLSNTVFLRVDLDGDPTFRELVARAHQTNLGALAHQDLPFDKIVEIAQPERDLGRTPLIQVMFVYRPDSRGAGDDVLLPGLDESLPFDNNTSKFDLTFGVEENRGTFRLGLEYSTDLFDESTAGRIAAHWQTLLDAAVADPDTPIGDLPLLPPAEEHRIVTEWNRTDVDFPRDRCLHELFEERADAAPDAPALITSADRLSYGELDRRANRLAHHLIAHGAGPDVPIGVCVDKSADLVVALLAVLKAGSAYLPLDPRLPQDRLDLMVADAGAPVLLTQQVMADRFAADVNVIAIDGERARIGASPDHRPAPAVSPENLAYVIFTSGSTGRMKGVLLDHRGRVNNFSDFNRRYRIGPGDRTLALAATGFDMSAYDVFGTLMAGACIVMPDPGTERDPGHWQAMVREHGVTVWHSVPALLEMFVESCEAEPDVDALPVRLVLLGGDWIPLTLPDRLRALAPEAAVVGMGGATEVSMDSTIFDIGEVDPRWRSIPYGRPMANQRCFVLDARLRPVPVGVAGDLYLAGVGVARGYLGDPELTRERFLPSPLPQWPDERLYKTGDRARYRPDGTLELLGRSDFQLKVRGWRIEPGEVEAALRAQPGIDEALVTLSAPDGAPRRLIGYVLTDRVGDLDQAAVREALQAVLPDYMVPAVLVPLASFPLTRNGKVDRRRLPEPESGGASSGTPYVPPRSRVERILVDIWQDQLGLGRVGVDDNFFALGGDSITTIQVITRAKRMGVGISPRQMFQHQTVAGLARVATTDAADAEPVHGDLPLSAPTAADMAVLRTRCPDLVDAYPLLPMQRHMVRRQCERPRPGQYIIQADYLFVRGGMDMDALAEAWRHAIRRHATLRTSFHWEGLSEPLQVVHPDADIEVRQHDLTGLETSAQVERQDEIVRADREEGFDLSTAPLLRLHLLRIDADTYKYVCTNHHIALDGWSRAIVQQEVFAIYQGLIDGAPRTLPDLTPLRDYVAWLRNRDVAGAKEFWRAYLSGFDAPTPLVAAMGYAEPRYGPRFAKQRVPLSAPTREALARFCREHRLTANTVMQGAWQLLMAAYTGQEDIVLGVTSSGRSTDFAGVETVTGLCMNTLPVRTRIDPEMAAVDWLRALQAHQVELRQHEYTPVEEVLGSELVELFSCMMVFENYPWDGSLNNLADRIDFEHPLAQSDYQVAQFEFPLRVEVAPGSNTLLVMHYYPGVFADQTVTEMMADWDRTIARIVDRAADPLGTMAVADATPSSSLLP